MNCAFGTLVAVPFMEEAKRQREIMAKPIHDPVFHANSINSFIKKQAEQE